MTPGDRESLVGRILQSRRVATRADPPKDAPDTPERLRAIETRLSHLEQLVEGLQDSVHRESERHARMIAELQAQIEPGAMSASLADHARHHGL